MTDVAVATSSPLAAAAAREVAGVGAAVFDSTTGLATVADPRREGATCIYEH